MSNQIVRMVCPNLRCRTVLSVPVSARGKNVRCRQCGFRIKIPDTVAHKSKPSDGDGASGNDAA